MALLEILIILMKCESVDVMAKDLFLAPCFYQITKALIILAIKRPMSLAKVSNNKVSLNHNWSIKKIISIKQTTNKHIIHYHYTHTVNNVNHVDNKDICYLFIMKNQCVSDNNGKDLSIPMFINNNGDL